MAMRRTVKIEGIENVERNLRKLGEVAMPKVIRPALHSAAKVVVDAMKGNVPVETETLKESLGKKVWANPSKSVLVAIIGPRRKRSRTVTVNGKTMLRIPTKYAHLVEKHSHFMKQAFDSTRDAVQRRLMERIGRGIEREAAKLPKGPKI